MCLDSRIHVAMLYPEKRTVGTIRYKSMHFTTKWENKLLTACWSTLCHLFHCSTEETLNVRKQNFILLTSISIASQTPAISWIITAAFHSQKSCHKDRKWINEYLCCYMLLLLLPHSIREEIKAHKRKLINFYS